MPRKPLPPTADQLINEHEQATLLGLSVETLRKDRQGQRRIPFLRVGGRTIRYCHARTLAALEAAAGGWEGGAR